MDFHNLEASHRVDQFLEFLEAAGVNVPECMTGKSLLDLLRSAKSGRVEPARDSVVTARDRRNRLVGYLQILRPQQLEDIRDSRSSQRPRDRPSSAFLKGNCFSGWPRPDRRREAQGSGGREFGGDASGQSLREVSYTRNNLNQYTKIEHPGTFDVMGRAPAGWEIEVEYPTGTTHYPATDGSRQGERFRVELSYDNETNDASLESVVVRGDEDDPIPDPPDVEKTVKQWVPNNGAVFGSSPM